VKNRGDSCRSLPLCIQGQEWQRSLFLQN